MSAPNLDAPPAPRRFQFNLATLLVVMAWIAVSCVALRTPTAAWSGAIFCLTLLALATSLLAVIYRTEGSRAFAVGFLVCGLGYATCLFVVEHQFTAAPLIQAPSTRLALWLFVKLHANNVQTVTVPAGGMGGGGFGGGECSRWRRWVLLGRFVRQAVQMMPLPPAKKEAVPQPATQYPRRKVNSVRRTMAVQPALLAIQWVAVPQAGWVWEVAEWGCRCQAACRWAGCREWGVRRAEWGWGW
jgi:hypothetical protein